ncbi:hypothetical protein [Microbacterium sp. G2-8]|uniref:hypothetical protein n=1 Tax=Microbacterium sp. G2-8 TaxID=2842454 RepID=UPI001C8A7C49|nr:hypothetical protein [Microbacterium sp. G2-8]
MGADDVNAREKEIAVVNPYAGGGGGTVLAHRIATSYLADVLLGAGRPETDELPVVRVAFQTSPTDPVDDLRVEAERNGETVVVHIAARRAPQFTRSHSKTAKLVRTLIDQVERLGEDERAYVAVAVATVASSTKEVQLLASLARNSATEADFYSQVHTPERHSGYAKRYENLTQLVAQARSRASADELRGIVWSLLNRLWILSFCVESDDETDWVEIGNRLNPLARHGQKGTDVRDALYSAGSTQFDQQGTVVDRALLRRKFHSVLAADAGRSKDAWAQLSLEQESARVAVRHDLADGTQLPRAKLQADIQAAIAHAGKTHGALLVTGESGIGKSAVTLSSAAALADSNSDFQCVVLNLRRTRDSVAVLSADLGMSLTDVLGEMSAPDRVLIIDAADAANEGRAPLLRELAAATHAAGVGIVLVAADTAVSEASNTLHGIYPDPQRFEVPGLDDNELRAVGTKVPAIAGALRNIPTKSLFRRLAIIDLLARTGSAVTKPLADWDCLELIWQDLIGRAVGQSSAAARTATLLSMSESALGLPNPEKAYSGADYAALDSLRADRLVAPANLRRPAPEFAHDEVRRFATAVCLVQAPSLSGTLKTSGPARWSMSAAKLACEGRLSGANDPHAELAIQIADFDALGEEASVRWKDVPLEAVLEMPNSYALLRRMIDESGTDTQNVLANIVRVVSLHQRHDNMIDVLRGEPVVRLLVEETEQLWHRDNETYRLVSDWLKSSLLEQLSAGNSTRLALRRVLLDHWHKHYPQADRSSAAQELEGDAVFNVFQGHTTMRRRRSKLNWQITEERFVELLALLGPDINDETRACLLEVAAESPSRLQPAVDFSWSAWGLGMHDPQLLLTLTESYYIDHEGSGGWRHWDGIRDHQRHGSYKLSNHMYGPFWVLTRFCSHVDWIPVVNRMLNHAANIRCRTEDGSGSIDPGSKVTLAIDGTERTYVGDGNVWGWYRGNTNGPYPCMSALQAVERWVDHSIRDGAAIGDVATALLSGCENLAIPALLLGVTIRHLGDDATVLDRYLVEPLVWQLDLSRATHEAVGIMLAADDGIINPERRKWQLRDVAAFLVLNAGAERRSELRDLGQHLIANSDRAGIGESTVIRWAATLDADNMETEPIEGGLLVSFNEPKAIEEELAPLRADLGRGSLLIGLQNKYWIPAREQKDGWEPPTPGEIAEDLSEVKDLYENPPEFAAYDLPLVVAHVSAAAVRSAAAGNIEAFGVNASFAINCTLGILRAYADASTNDVDALEYEDDIGTRGAAASAVPYLLLSELTEQLAIAGVIMDDIETTVATFGQLAATDTCLSFARSCDAIWDHPCSGSPCIHTTAYKWVLDLAALCEVPDFDDELQEPLPREPITENIADRVSAVEPGRLDTSRLSATIRAAGHAAISKACIAKSAQSDLKRLLQAQAIAMVVQETSEGVHFIDDHGAETVSAARALLQNRSLSDENLLLSYVTTLMPASQVFSAFLRDLAAVGTESQELADSAKELWPTLLGHVLNELDANKDLYGRDDTFGGYALGHLLPSHPLSARGLHEEFGRSTFDWVHPEVLVEFIPRWLPHAAGRMPALLDLVRFLRRLPIDTQLGEGLNWLSDMCFSRPDRQITSSEVLEEWLVKVKHEVDVRGNSASWLNFVDRLVYAGNTALAGFSR